MSGFEEFAALVVEFYPDLAPASLFRATPGTFNPVTGASPATTQAIPCRALADTRTTKAANGDLTTTTKLIITVEPREGDTLALGAMRYALSEIGAEAPDGVPIVYYAVGKQ